MKIPKELIPELLGLVLGMKIKHINSALIDNGCKYVSPTIMFKNDDGIEHLSIDTLTRLMKEWCLKQNVNLAIKIKRWEDKRLLPDYYCFLNEQDATIAKTEFEAVLKATYWCASEKGLI